MLSHVRENISQPLTTDYFNERLSQGWVLTAVEWTVPHSGVEVTPAAKQEEVPYGLKVSDDCSHLNEDPSEMGVIFFIYSRIISGLRPAHIALELNRHQHRRRDGLSWTASDVFDLMPRIIELSPRLQRHADWPSRRAELEVIS